MNYEELKAAVLALNSDDQKRLILETFPELARDAVKDPGFLLQLLPAFLGVLRDSGMDLQQLLQLAGMFSGAPKRTTEE